MQKDNDSVGEPTHTSTSECCLQVHSRLDYIGEA